MLDFCFRFMGMEDEVATNLKIKQTFRLAGFSNQDTLFVEFWEEDDIKCVNSHVSAMESDCINPPKIVPFIPKSLTKEHSHLLMLANAGRARIPRHASKIWIGKDGYELRLRVKGDFMPWSEIQKNNY